MHKSGKIIIGVFIVIVLGCAIYRLVCPPLSNRLVNSSWCVDDVYYNGRRMGPRTLHAVYLVAKGKKPCIDMISFMDEGEIQLPGLNTRAIEGGWQDRQGQKPAVKRGYFAGGLSGEL